MNVNSFQDREYVIPCPVLTKQAKNRQSYSAIHWSSQQIRLSHFHLAIQESQAKIINSFGNFLTNLWTKHLSRQFAKKSKVAQTLVVSGKHFIESKDPCQKAQGDIMDLEFHSRSKILFSNCSVRKNSCNFMNILKLSLKKANTYFRRLKIF